MDRVAVDEKSRFGLDASGRVKERDVKCIIYNWR